MADDTSWVAEPLGDGAYRVTTGQDAEIVYVAGAPGDMWAFWRGQVFRGRLGDDPTDAPSRPRHGDAHTLMAPMPAKVRSVLVDAGALVAVGDTLLVLEAMKMELPIRAPEAGRVVRVNCREGEMVQPDTVLVEITGPEAGTS